MIKRLRFAGKREGVADDDFAAAWRSALGASAAAPREVRPLRVTVSTRLPGMGEERRHDGLGVEWFLDTDHLAQFDAWRARMGFGRPHAELVDPAASPVVVAEEVVLRGEGWLLERWQSGREVLKHVAVATRAPGLTPAEFAERWRGHAGSVGGAKAVAPTPIPADVKGEAYVQNHPRPRTSGAWAYDAVNEVFFDDTESLQRRVDWFRENKVGQDDELFGDCWFLAMRETVLVGAAR